MQVLARLANENMYECKRSLDEAEISPVFDRHMTDLYLIGGGGGDRKNRSGKQTWLLTSETEDKFGQTRAARD